MAEPQFWGVCSMVFIVRQNLAADFNANHPILTNNLFRKKSWLGKKFNIFFLGQLTLLRLLSLFFLRPYCLFNRIIKFKVRLQEALVFDRALCLPDDQATGWCSSAFMKKWVYSSRLGEKFIIIFFSGTTHPIKITQSFLLRLVSVRS